ncbi:MAG TPA: hypothetical protein VH044_01845 [Polyangiaceae bacterium]|nr:hypothetical protein [Polyangiaceae bacterium]
MSVDEGTLPCNIKTGFGGDSMCIAAPTAEQGFQFHYGPSDYNDAAEVAKYTLHPGQEVTDCVFFPTPNAQDVYFNTYHARMRPGSHHMLLYIQDTVETETGKSGPVDCNQGPDTRNLFGAQTPTLDVEGNADGAPENNGFAVKIPAHQQGVMQLHFINAGTKDILREAWANVLYTDKSQVTQIGDPIFFIAGVTMDVQKGQTVVIKGTAPVPGDAGPDFRLVSGTPHYHTHTTRFTAYATIGGVQQKILEEFNPLHNLPEPKLVYFDSVMQNTPSNPAAKTSGAASGVLNMKPGDHIDWECEVTNDDVPQGITFQNAVYVGEMCNMFGVYGPTTGTPWSAPNL